MNVKAIFFERFSLKNSIKGRGTQISQCNISDIVKLLFNYPLRRNGSSRCVRIVLRNGLEFFAGKKYFHCIETPRLLWPLVSAGCAVSRLVCSGSKYGLDSCLVFCGPSSLLAVPIDCMLSAKRVLSSSKNFCHPVIAHILLNMDHHGVYYFTIQRPLANLVTKLVLSAA